MALDPQPAIEAEHINMHERTQTLPFGAEHGTQHKRYIMGITSLWLLVPVVFGSCARPERWEAPLALTIWTAIVCSVSTSCYYFLDTKFAKLMLVDKIFAPVMFVALIVFFSFGHGARPLSIGELVAIPSLVGVFFLSSRFFELIRPNAIAATFSHLTFRYIGYWWVYLALTPPEVEPAGFWVSFVIDSSLYWGHIVYSILWTGIKPKFHLRSRYMTGCFELCVTITVLVCVHRALAREGSCAFE